MEKGQQSVRGGIQDVLCPFTDWYCTQGADDTPSHMGSEANDIIGERSGIRYPYYAPVDVRCVNINRTYAFVWWQSIEKVRLADGSIDYVTFLCGHDNVINCYVGQSIKQGVKIGNMGNAGKATGVHCHIEVGRGKQDDWFPNEDGVYCIPNQMKLEDAFFMDNTNIIRGVAEWKYLKDVKVKNHKVLNLSPEADSWRVYPLDKAPVVGNECGVLAPSQFDGLSYTILDYARPNIAIIKTKDFGKVQIYIGNDVLDMFTITDTAIYQLVN